MSEFALQEVEYAEVSWSFDRVDTFLREKGGLPDVGAAIFRPDDPMRVYIAEYNDETIGLCQIRSDRGHIKSIGILTEYRGYGVGRQMIEAVAESASCEEITASPVSGSRRFYEKLGMTWKDDLFRIKREELLS